MPIVYPNGPPQYIWPTEGRIMTPEEIQAWTNANFRILRHALGLSKPYAKKKARR